MKEFFKNLFIYSFSIAMIPLMIWATIPCYPIFLFMYIADCICDDFKIELWWFTKMYICEHWLPNWYK